MNVLLLQLDGRHNLALMRLAAFHRAQGDVVEYRKAGNAQALEPRLDDRAFDEVYASCIFERSRPLANRVQQIYPSALVGGTGWDLALRLPPEVEACAPDYQDHPNITASIGWTQRGCRMACDFCVVPRKEGKVTVASPTLHAIWRGDPWPKHILLLDNDFFGQPRWRAIIDEAVEHGFKICWNQGINARMLNRDVANAIALVDYRDDQFRTKRVYTAWDGKNDERTLFRGLRALADAGVKPDHIMVYMLIGHEAGETHADRDYRRAKLREFGCRPYPMPFVRTPELVGFQRWVIGAYDKKDTFPWEKWKAAKYEPRKLGERRVSLPLFPDEDGEDETVIEKTVAHIEGCNVPVDGCFCEQCEEARDL